MSPFVPLCTVFFELLCLIQDVESYSRHNLLDNVSTNLSVAFAQATRNVLSSSVSQGTLPGLKLGSAGSKAGNYVGAATSFGLSRTRATDIFVGVSAAQSKTGKAISRIFNGSIEDRSIGSGSHRDKRREATSAATSLNEVSRPGTVGSVGSTGVQAGPVATAISLGSLLAQLHHSLAAINAGATAAHAGNSDSSTTFSNSNLGSAGYPSSNLDNAGRPSSNSDSAGHPSSHANGHREDIGDEEASEDDDTKGS